MYVKGTRWGCRRDEDSRRYLQRAYRHAPLVALATDGYVHTVSATGNVTRTSIAPLRADARVGAFVVSDAASSGVAICEAGGCTFYSCKASGACSQLAVTPMQLGAVSIMTVGHSGDVWLSSRKAGLVKFSAKLKYAATRFGRKVVGNVTAIAIFDDSNDGSAR